MNTNLVFDFIEFWCCRGEAGARLKGHGQSSGSITARIHTSTRGDTGAGD